MEFERIEWIEFKDEDFSPSSKKETNKSVLAKSCPLCGWLDDQLVVECFRCGYNFLLGNIEADFLKNYRYQPPKIHISLDKGYIDIIKSRICEEDDKFYKLRLKSEKMNLVKGFDTLLSLDNVNIEHYEHQIQAVKTALNKMRGQVLLADEPGLGKTIQAGLIMKELLLRKLIKKILILTPASVVKQWDEELTEKFREKFHIATSPEDWDKPKVLASLSLAKLKNHASKILQNEYDLVIIDEAHMLKRKSTQRFKFVNQIKKKYILLLTATPVHNYLSELYSLITILKPGLLGTIRKFNSQFVDKRDARRPLNTAHLKNILSQVMIRNTRNTVGVKLPPRIAGIIYLTLSPKEQLFYDNVTRYIREEFKKQTKNRFRILSLTTLQRELCSSPQAVRETLKEMLSREHYPEVTLKKLKSFLETSYEITTSIKTGKVLELLSDYKGKMIIYTNFLATMEHLKEVLTSHNITTVLFHGGLSIKERKDVIEMFKKKARVLISTQSGGEGLNLQFCNQLINYDLPWNPMLIEQRIGRIHRLGQKEPVFVFNLALKNTIDERVIDILANKINMFQLVIGELDLILSMSDSKKSFEQEVLEMYLSSTDERKVDRLFKKFGERLTKLKNKYLQIKQLNRNLIDSLG